METWVMISLIAINLLSLVVLLLVKRDAARFVYSQVMAIGDENENWVKTKLLVVFAGAYFLTLFLLAVLSFAVYFYLF